MKNILKNKILLIFLIFLLMISIFTNCFASYNFSYEGSSYEFSLQEEFDNFEYIVIGICSNSFFIYVSHDDFDIVPCEHLSTCYTISSVNSYHENTRWLLSQSYSSTEECVNALSNLKPNRLSLSEYGGLHNGAFNPTSCIFYSYHKNIYDSEGKLVFPKAPQTVEQVTIPTITQVAEIPQTMNKVLMMILPIGLIIFGIGLLIYLLQLVISRMT